jgi:replicative DNA helicase
MSANRVPPHNLQAEASILGALLIDPEAVIEVSEQVTASSFYDPSYEKIFEVMMTLYEDRQPIDVVTVTNLLKKRKELKQVGGSAAIASLANAVSTSSNAAHYAKIVYESALRRTMISAGGQISSEAFDETKDTRDILDGVEQQIFSLSQKQGAQAFLHIKDTLADSFDRIDELQRNGGELRGLPTGLKDLDTILTGLQKSNLVILAARPGMGKTSLALNIAQNISVVAKKKVAMFSLEMSREELVDRMIVGQADIDAWKLKTGKLDQQDFLKISDAMGVLAEASFFIDDTPGLSIYEMRTKARRIMMEHEIDMLIVDYLQLAHGRTRDNRVQEVAEISQGLKNIARELKIPVLALSQLSRAVESRGEKIPQLSDLRESGCVTGDTLVTRADTNRQMPIKSLVGKEKVSVWSLNLLTQKLEAMPVTNVFSTGSKQVFKLQTKLGRIIKATANHKFLTMAGWKRLDELQLGQHLALPRIIPARESTSMSDDELALLGHLIGDGCTLPRHSIQYTTRESDLAEIVAHLAENIFSSEVAPKIKKEKTWFQVYLTSTRQHTHGVGSAVSSWLKELDVWGLRSYEKYVPVPVFAQSKEKIGVFLRHLWSTDGCIRLRKGRKPYPAVYYATSSKQLALGVQSLLLQLGIISRIKEISQKEKGRDQYHVIISGKTDLTTFINQVGAVGVYKNTSLKEIQAYLSDVEENTNRDVIPSEIWGQAIKPIMKLHGMTQRALCEAIGTAKSGAMFKQNISRARLGRIVAALHNGTKLQSFAQSDIYWDKITSIEAQGIEEVFDMTVPPHANFVANNIIIHNSIEQDADVVMFLYRKDEDIRESVSIRIAKHRNGPIGDIDLYFRGGRMKFYGLEQKQG